MSISRKLLGKTLFSALMKSTFYGHFVAGEDQKGIRSNVENMMKYGVKSILDYSAEEDLASESSVKNSSQDESLKALLNSRRKIVDPSEYQCEKNTKIFVDCIDAVSDVTAATGIGAVKLTSLVRPQLLLKFSSFFSQLKTINGEKNLIAWKQLVSKTPKELSEYFNNMPALKVKLYKKKNLNFIFAKSLNFKNRTWDQIKKLVLMIMKFKNYATCFLEWMKYAK